MEPNDVVLDSVALPERAVDVSGEIPDKSPVESSVASEEVPPAEVPDVMPDVVQSVVQAHVSTARRVYTMEDRLRAKEVRRQVAETMLAAVMTYAVDKRDALADLVSPTSELVSVTNDEVEAHCDVSDTTAGKYLRELVSRGLLVKCGTGRGTRYEVV
jgi:predicted HTH transcriptional regulator